MGKEFLYVSHVSRNDASYTITIPREVVEVMDIGSGSMLGFFEEDGRIVIRKVE